MGAVLPNESGCVHGLTLYRGTTFVVSLPFEKSCCCADRSDRRWTRKCRWESAPVAREASAWLQGYIGDSPPCSGSRHRSLTFALFLDVRILDVSVTFEDGEIFACSDLGNGEVRGLTPVAHGFILFVDRTKIR